MMGSMPGPAPPFFLALDQGSHASKALVFDAAGACLVAAERLITTRQPHPGWVEHDADEIVASLEAAIDEAVSRAGLSAADFAAAGLACQRSSVVCWDRESGAALSPVLSWQDRRNAAWLAARPLDPRQVHALTGLVVSPHYGASKLRWCLDQLPAVQAANSAGRLCCGPLASFLLHRLLVERPVLADPANAARTLLWDLRALDWSQALLEAFELPRGCLPACVPNRWDYGHLALRGGAVPLRVATGDQPAALFAGGRPDPRMLYANLGTGAFVQRVFAGTPPDVPGLLRGFAWVDGEDKLSVLEGTVNGAGAALAWLAGERDLPVERLAADAERWLGEIGDPPLFCNGVGGLGSPWWRADCPVRFSTQAGLEAETVAVLESIVFLLQRNIESLLAAPGVPLQRICISGGLAHLDGLCQRLADLSGLEVCRPESTEATATGLAWLLGARAGARAAARSFRPAANPALERRCRQALDYTSTLSRPPRT